MTVWMNGVFQTVADMGASAAIAVLTVLALRGILKKAPKKYICFLWLIVMFRFLCPVVAEGPLPRFWDRQQSNEQQDRAATNGQIGEYRYGEWERLTQEAYSADWPNSMHEPESGMQAVLKEETEPLSEQAEEVSEKKTAPDSYGEASVWRQAGAWAVAALPVIWFCGMLLFLFYGIFRLLYLKSRLRTAADRYLKSPVVFGLFHPRIYLPADFDQKTEEREYALILRHEEAHIARKDMLFKLFSYLALSVHWINPFAWIAVSCLQKDMEMACDEYVMAHERGDAREEYARALLHFSMKRSGLAKPLAFGESNTESRIKNILRYKKTSIMGTALLILLVAAAAILLATKPREIEKEKHDALQTASQESIPSGGEIRVLEDGTIVYPQLTDMVKNYQEDWQEQLIKEGIPADAGKIYSYLGAYNMTQEDIEEFTGKPKEIEISFYYYILDENYIPSFFKTKVLCLVKADGIYVTERMDYDFRKITDEKQATELEVNPFLWVYGLEGLPDGEQRTAAYIERAVKASAEEKIPLMEQPETALELLLHLEGGTAQSHSYGTGSLYSKIVTYTFADGGRISYEMSRNQRDGEEDKPGSFWFPVGKINEEMDKEAEQISECLQRVTLQELRSATAFSMAGVEKITTFSEEYVLLSQAADKDAALYGLCGGGAMVLRAGEEIYPVSLYWTSPQMRIPELYVSDYDGDGKEEYAIYTLMGTGTGVSVAQLYMVETDGEDFAIREFEYADILRQLERITYTWDEEYEQVQVSVDGVYQTWILAGKYLKEEDLHFESLSWGDILGFVERDGQWYLSGKAGITPQEWATPSYSCGMNFLSTVSYSEDGSFTLGEIRVEDYYEEIAGEQEEEAAERILFTREADLTHDGIADRIVVSVTEGEGSDSKEPLPAAEIGYVRVYDGTSTASERDLGYCLWETDFAHARAGNKQIALVSREGKDYLLMSYMGEQQGSFAYSYQVFSLDVEKRCYIEEEYAIGFDLEADRYEPNAEQKREIADFRERMERWFGGAELLASTDINAEECCMLGTQKKPLAPEAYYDEVWKRYP